MFGSGIFAILVTLFYRFGVPLDLAGRIAVALALPNAVLVIVHKARDRTLPGRSVIFVSLALVGLLALLPKWIGPPEFSVFQGNGYDHFNYMTAASGYRHFSYAELRDLEPATALRSGGIASFAQLSLDQRPTVAIAYGSLLSLYAEPITAKYTYAFSALHQVVIFCAAVFLLLNVFSLSPARACVVGAALALGFHVQYVVDINAWSQLAGTGPAVLAIGVLALGLTDGFAGGRAGAVRFALAIWLLATSILYLYPEIVIVYAMGGLAVALCVLYAAQDRKAVLWRCVWVGVGCVGALAACLPFWSGTVVHLVGQTQWTMSNDPDWWTYFLTPLWGRDINSVPLNSGGHVDWYVIFSRPVEFIAGATGLSFLLPEAHWPHLIRIVWKLAGYVGIAMVVWGSFVAWTSLMRDAGQRRGGALLGALFGMGLVMLLLLASHHYWAAGKALWMAGPIVLLVIVAPLLVRGPLPAWSRAVATFVIAANLAFGVERSIAATDKNGIHYNPSYYPSIQNATYKTDFKWDLVGLAPSIAKCESVEVDIENPFLERLAMILLVDLGVKWASRIPINNYYGLDPDLGIQPPLRNPDCLLATSARCRFARQDALLASQVMAPVSQRCRPLRICSSESVRRVLKTGRPIIIDRQIVETIKHHNPASREVGLTMDFNGYIVQTAR